MPKEGKQQQRQIEDEPKDKGHPPPPPHKQNKDTYIHSNKKQNTLFISKTRIKTINKKPPTITTYYLTPYSNIYIYISLSYERN